MKSLIKQILTVNWLAVLSIAVLALPGAALAADGNRAAVARDATVKVNRDDLAAPLAQSGEVRVIVGFRPTRSFAARPDANEALEKERDVGDGQHRLMNRMAGHRVRNLKLFRFHHFAAMTVDSAALSALLTDPDVTSVAEDRKLYPVLADTPGVTRADKAWVEGFRGAGQAVAILDSGVYTAHPFFAGKIIAEACFSAPAGTGFTSYCPNPQAPTAQFPGTHQIGPGAGVDCPDGALGCWHGTHVAGIAAGKTGVLPPAAGGLTLTPGGMAPDANIIPIQVFQKDCSGANCAITAFDSDLVHALEYVYSLRTTYNIASANMSLGGGLSTTACDASSPAMTSVINSLRSAGIATVIAAGNDGNTGAISFPACISSSISVGSTTKQNGISSFSNSSSLLKLLAPGSGITSSVPGGGFGGANGTSMATPHVAGSWAVIKSAKPTATVVEVLNALQNGGLPITDPRNGISKRLIQLGYDATSLGALGTILGHGNVLPTVSITAPLKGAALAAPANVGVAVAANDTDGGVAKVEYFSGATKIFESTASPFSFIWTNVPVGNYTLTAKVTDILGGTAVSGPVNISVTVNAVTYAISGTVTAGGTALNGVGFAGGAGTTCTPSNAAGQYSCTLPQGYTGNITPILNGYGFTPTARSYTNVAAGQSGQDYIAAPLVDTVWLNDSVPAGAAVGGNDGGWNWVSSNPAPFSGSVAHQSNIASGEHQHYFVNASNTLSVGVGEKLFTYVYLDPANPPSQVMLQWNDGTWEHRAYWGTNLLGWGTEGTASLRFMGALPAAGQWVRLEVSAALVGLEGRVLNGMAFTLFGGRATWDYAGKAPSATTPSFTVVGTVTAGGSALNGVTFNGGAGTSCTPSNAAGQYSCTVPQGYTGSITPTLSGYTFTPSARSYSNVTANQSAQNYTGSVISPSTFTVSGSVTAGGSALNGVVFSGGAGATCTSSNAAGQYSCTVPQGYTGSITPALSGYTFTPSARSYSNVTANQGAQDYTAAVNLDTVWFDDTVPVGATVGGDDGGWNWVNSNPAPYSGSVAHQSNIAAGLHQHYFYSTSNTLNVGVGEKLFTYVYLDPANPPSEVMLQWNDGGWEHRAYWGANSIPWGDDGTASRYYMGALPAVGQWVRLEVPASLVGLEGRVINGMAFTLFDGRATWDYAGKTAAAADPTTFTVSGIVTASGSPQSGVSFSGGAGAACVASNAAGQYSCTVAQGYTGTITPALSGYNFTPVSRSYSNVTANQSVQGYTAAVVGSDTVWIDDVVPAGAAAGGDDGWNWVSSNPVPFSGSVAHRSALASGLHQHYFYGATPLSVGVGDKLFTYVYLDPANPPSEVMLQWNDGSWEHRAYWGTNSIPWGVDGTASRYYMGPLPAVGQWVRLEVPASLVGLEGRVLNGMAFTLYNGRATWDSAGKM